MSGLGGRIQVIYKTSSGNIAGIDGSTEVPGNYVDKNEKFKYGYPTIGIPGVVAGLLSLHEGKGNLPLERLSHLLLNMQMKDLDCSQGSNSSTKCER